ncbi:MAG: hypothetical protein ACXAC7_07430 [Candidatus Hodarchaeales archaeon]|jgi:hypothetical protein
MLDIVLIARESIPIFFVSKKSDLNDVATAAFISALRSFARGSLKTELVSVRLGSLDIQLKETDRLLYVFGTEITSTNQLSSDQLEYLISQFEAEWKDNVKDPYLIDREKIPTAEFHKCIEVFETEILAQHKKLQVLTGHEVSHSLNDWELLPKNTQKSILKIIEPIILGEEISVLDNDPTSEITRQISLLFRLTDQNLINSSLSTYRKEIQITEQVSGNGITINPKNGEITGKVQKNKYLEKFVTNEVINQQSLSKKLNNIKFILSTIGTATKVISSLESKFTTEQGNIQNMLNSLGFEEARLTLELIRKNNTRYHEKLSELPIHQEWFSGW